jgi:cytoskeletal protein CcmA (bactofilin family)
MKEKEAKRKEEVASEISGFIGEGTVFTGEIRFKDAFRIDGTVKGKVISEDMLIVGKNGYVEADVDVGILTLSGTVRGSVRARERLEILSTGKIYGDMKLDKPNFVVEKGGVFEGQVDMKFKEKKE